jgi:hypothetical protein
MPTPKLRLLPRHLGCNDNVQTQAPTPAEMTDAAKRELLELLDFTIAQVNADEIPSFKDFEHELRERVQLVARFLVMLFLCLCEQRVADALEPVVEVGGRRYKRRPPIARNLMTVFGVVRYFRTYLRGPPVKKGRRRGFHPLDALLGLTKDRLSMGVLAIGAYLATKMSFSQARECLMRTRGEAPSTEVLEKAVLGLGAHADAFFEQAPAPEGDGEVLVIQFDGKGAPTATARELELRRGPRDKSKRRCRRHRGRACRKAHKSKNRLPGEAKDPGKNAKMATVVVMYTLRRGADGQLHGPLNKRVYASFAPKKSAFVLARREAIKRGFDPDSDDKLIHVLTDGDDDLARLTAATFRHAVHTIDFMHVAEYVWKAARCIYTNDADIRQCASRQNDRLLRGRVDLVIKELDAALARSTIAKKDVATIECSRNYILKRSDKLDYAWLRQQDLDIASGAVEGAVKHIVGFRFDNGGMRWIRERAEPLLKLRCIVYNGDWDAFIDYVHEKLHAAGRKAQAMRILRNIPEPLPKLVEAA